MPRDDLSNDELVHDRINSQANWEKLRSSDLVQLIAHPYTD